LKEGHVKARYVLNSTTDSFFEDLEKLIKELNPTIYFDYLSGDLPSKIFKLMPLQSELRQVGILTG
jgi:hypothetical protein